MLPPSNRPAAAAGARNDADPRVSPERVQWSRIVLLGGVVTRGLLAASFASTAPGSAVRHAGGMRLLIGVVT